MKDYLERTYAELLAEADGALLWVTLNRPDHSNAFSDAMITDLCRLLRDAEI